MNEFNSISNELTNLIQTWEKKLSALSENSITQNRNTQNRNIKQIVGHMADSATNNTHRIVHLQYQDSPLEFPNYATKGNNDRWIAIQDYLNEDWVDLVQLWKYSNLHFAHIIRSIDTTKLNNEWISSPNNVVTLKDMVIDFPRHFILHLDEIQELISTN